MRRLLGLLSKDFTVAYRNYFFLIVFVVAALLIAATVFLVPEQLSTGTGILYTLDEVDSSLAKPVIALFEGHKEYKRLDSKEAIVEQMKKNKNTVGIVIYEEQEQLRFEVIMQGFENERSKNAMALTLESLANIGQLQAESIETVLLDKDMDYGKIAFNKSIVPLLLLNEPIMLGFIFLATLIFMEREEDTIKAYMVTPGRIKEYLLSKIILMMVLSLISTILITVFTVGIDVNWLMLIAITIAGSWFSSCMAMLLGSFFDSISKAMIWILGISLVLSVPMAAYFVPSFSPAYLTVIPTYDLMFALREAVFPGTNPAVMYRSILILAALGAIMYAMSVLSYKRSLARD